MKYLLPGLPTYGIKLLPETIKKFKQLLVLDNIERNHLKILSPPEVTQFRQYIITHYQTLNSAEAQAFHDKISGITEDSVNDNVWEMNNLRITDFIASYIRQYGKMPSKTCISQRTGLSRSTVTRHLLRQQNDGLHACMEQFRFMAPEIAARITSRALSGDLRACRLYFDLLKQSSPQNTIIQSQHNYIQVNGITLNQQVLEKLRPQQLQRIEAIIKEDAEPMENDNN